MLGRVAAPRAIDLHGFEAMLTVERALVGDDAPGAEVRVGWEELARGAPPRLAEGSHVVVALDVLPTQSLWQKRFPAGGVRVIAGRGTGILGAPSETTLRALGAFLSLSEAVRESEVGVSALTGLVSVAAPPLALAAVVRLGEVADLAASLTEASANSLSKTVRDEARPLSIRNAVLELAAERRLTALRPVVQASLEGGPPLDVTAWQSLAALDGKISPDAVALLFEREEPVLRTLAVRHARDTPTEAQVATALRADPAPQVRSAAVRVWCDWHGIAAAEIVEPALFDPAPEVRGAAAESLGGLGETLVPRFEELALGSTGKAATGPLLALRYAGSPGRLALNRMEREHRDPDVRKLATFIAGKPLVDH
ncbi:MAG: hypothetical protein OEP95_03485 [Myxococcales bacterium]|nr:hypothetical protein [Myxococcales bacterium]